MTSIKAVARHCGVSVTTVSHVMNQPDRVSAKTRALVEASITELGYKPNLEARALRTGRTGIVSVIIPDIANPWWAELVLNLQHELAMIGLEVIIQNVDVPGTRNEARIASMRHQIHARRVDGAIISDHALRTVGADVIPRPCIVIGDPGELDNVASVRSNDAEGASLLAEAALRAGKKSAAIIGGPEGFPEGPPRVASFQERFEAGGGSVQHVWAGDFLRSGGRAAAEAYLALPENNRPDVIFSTSILMAISLLGALHDAQVDVPDAVGVLAFDDSVVMEDVRPMLTRAGPSLRDFAQTLSVQLTEVLDNQGGHKAHTHLVPCKLIEGQSLKPL